MVQGEDLGKFGAINKSKDNPAESSCWLVALVSKDRQDGPETESGKMQGPQGACYSYILPCSGQLLLHALRYSSRPFTFRLHSITFWITCRTLQKRSDQPSRVLTRWCLTFLYVLNNPLAFSFVSLTFSYVPIRFWHILQEKQQRKFIFLHSDTFWTNPSQFDSINNVFLTFWYVLNNPFVFLFWTLTFWYILITFVHVPPIKNQESLRFSYVLLHSDWQFYSLD